MSDMGYSDDDEPWYGGCDICESPLGEDGECTECAPRERLIDTTVIASFDITDGRVSFAGWCSP